MGRQLTPRWLSRRGLAGDFFDDIEAIVNAADQRNSGTVPASGLVIPVADDVHYIALQISGLMSVADDQTTFQFSMDGSTFEDTSGDYSQGLSYGTLSAPSPTTQVYASETAYIPCPDVSGTTPIAIGFRMGVSNIWPVSMIVFSDPPDVPGLTGSEQLWLGGGALASPAFGRAKAFKFAPLASTFSSGTWSLWAWNQNPWQFPPLV